MPADGDGLPRPESLAGGFPQLVLTPDDQLSGLVRLDPVLGLVAEIGALIDAARNAGPAADGFRRRPAVWRGLDAEMLRTDRHADAIAGPRVGDRIGHGAGELEPAVRLDPGEMRRRIERFDRCRQRVRDADRGLHSVVDASRVQD